MLTCVDVANRPKVLSPHSVSKKLKGGSSHLCLSRKTADDEEETLPQHFGIQLHATNIMSTRQNEPEV